MLAPVVYVASWLVVFVLALVVGSTMSWDLALVLYLASLVLIVALTVKIARAREAKDSARSSPSHKA